MRINPTRLIHGAMLLALASLTACGGGGGGGDSTTPATTYTIGGTISGLTGSGLVLQNSGGDNLSVSAGATSFTFSTAVASGTAYAVTVLTHPAGQTCAVTAGTGTVNSANVTNVSVACTSTANAYTIGGTIAGLTGTGLVLQNNGGDNLSVGAGATSFTFATPVASGATYNVTVLTPPAGQTCTVNPSSGTVSASNVTNVTVTCSSSAYTVGGTITGLTGTGLVLQNNGGDNLSVGAGATSFAFATPVASGANYNVTVLTPPTGQTCTVNPSSGTVGTANVTVAVACTSATTTYTVGGSVSGLTGTGLALQEGISGQNVSIDINGNFSFGTPLANASTYVVTVLTHPVGQTCSVTSGVGMISGANITNVSVTCSALTYRIGGTISGLTGDGLVLQNNGGDDLLVSAGATTFTFGTPISSSAVYAVTVLTQPAGQTCSVTSGTGTVATADVTSVSVTCSDATYTIGGTVTNLTGTGLVLQNNGGDNLDVPAAATSYTFSIRLAYNTGYNVTVLTQPTGPRQVCTVANASGTVTADVTANVTCVNAYTISGMIYGEVDGVGPILQNNGGDNLFIPTITTTGTQFTFTTPVADGATYTITQLARARAPAQDCRASLPVTGPVSGTDVTGLRIDCVISTIVPSFAYVTNGFADPVIPMPDTVSAFTIDAFTGVLAPATPSTTATGDQPYAVAVEPTGRFAYVVNSDSDSVSVYGIEPGGALTLIDADGSASGTQASIATDDVPKSIAIHPSGKFAYVLNQGNRDATNPTGETLSAYSINETSGALTAIDADDSTIGMQPTIATGTFPYEVAVDPLGRFAYVANYDDGTVSAYKVNATTGALTAVGTAVTAGTGPSSIAVDPTGKCALVANNTSNDVYSYAIDPNTGALNIATMTTPIALSAPRSVAVDPNTGLYAYVANAGGSVSAFSIDVATCAITEINADAGGAGPTIGAGTVPISINVDPSGQFVYVANFGIFDPNTRQVINAGNVSVYSINSGTGALTSVAGSPFAAGNNPTSVTTTD